MQPDWYHLPASGWLATLSDFVSLFLSYYQGLNDSGQSDQLPDCSNVGMCAGLWVTATVSCETKGQGSKEGVSDPCGFNLSNAVTL